MLCQISGPGKTFATELTRYIFKMYRFNMIHDIGSLLVREITYATLPESTFRSLYREQCLNMLRANTWRPRGIRVQCYSVGLFVDLPMLSDLTLSDITEPLASNNC